MMDSLQTLQLRNEQAKMTLEHQGDKAIRETKEKQKNEIEKVIEQQNATKTDLEKAFEVTLSTMADNHEKRLAEVRASYDKIIEDEKVKGETEAEKVKNRCQEQVARYRENSEKLLADLQKKTDDSAAHIKKMQERQKLKG